MSATPHLDAVRTWLDDHQQELLEATQKMLRINTIEGDAEPNAPYGRGNREALDLALAIAAERGFRTTDLEGHLGFAEFGSGEKLIMTLGHLDVVPVGPGWKHDPFGAEIDGGYIYARGALDDKGPSMAALYALIAIKEAAPDLGVRFRVAFGCDEESGFGCVERYVQTEESPTFGVAPDSGWPCYNAEKGIGDLLVTVLTPQGSFAVQSIVGGQRPNIVIDSAEAVVRVSSTHRTEVEQKIADNWDANLSFGWSGDLLTIRAGGKAAHGSTPFFGDNAVTRICRFLYAASPVADKEFFEALLEACHPSGVGLGIHGRDDVAGDLTSNLGIATGSEGKLDLLFNIRYCPTWTGEELLNKAKAKLSTLPGSWSVRPERDSKPLYFPADSDLVRTIVDVYEAETGERKAPGSMGGGTYARAVPNTISIGTGWAGDGDAHETDERLAVTSLHKMARIYAHLFLRLATL